MAWLRFPDGSRRKVERVDKPDAEADLKELLAERAGAAASVPRRERLASFDDVIDAWVEAGRPGRRPTSGAGTPRRSPRTRSSRSATSSMAMSGPRSAS
jgi:hypothetical protein